MLHDAAWRTTRAAGVDDAGQVIPPGGLFSGAGVGIGDAGRDHVGPEMAGQIPLRAPERFHADDEARLRSQHGGHQRLGQLGRRYDHRAGAAIGQDMLMIAGGIGGVGRDRHASRCHDGKIGDAEFGTVLTHQHDRVAGLQSLRLERGGKSRHLQRHLGPAERLPAASRLAPQEGEVAHFLCAGKEHGHQIGILFDRPQSSATP